jgi:DNA-3-methyladenine glycosylase I
MNSEDKITSDLPRCPWCDLTEKMMRYHDEEWGVPVHDDRKQFEFLMLEVMQCGLNWNMMIEKREIFRECFAGFDYDAVAAFGEADIERILTTPGMIKSRRKVEAVIHNAGLFQQMIAEYGSFDQYLWKYSGGKTILYMGHQNGHHPVKNGLSERISRDLKKRGFKYLGPVVLYSHLQACGVINDHTKECFRYQSIIENYPTVRKRRDNETY